LIHSFIETSETRQTIFCFRLVGEIIELGESGDTLKAKIHEAQNAQQQLLRTKLALEADLAVKNNSLFIDRDKCMGLRKSFILKPRLYSVITFNWVVCYGPKVYGPAQVIYLEAPPLLGHNLQLSRLLQPTGLLPPSFHNVILWRCSLSSVVCVCFFFRPQY